MAKCKHENYRELVHNAYTEAIKDVEKLVVPPFKKTILNQELIKRKEKS